MKLFERSNRGSPREKSTEESTEIVGASANVDIDPQEERKLVRKLDLMILPPVMLIYLLSFLDRVNIGNARLYGLEEDLGMVGNQYQTAVAVLFPTYIASELPSNLVLKHFRPSRWISFIMTSWGIVATLSGVTQSYAGLLVCRLLLGAFEGGLFPGMVVYFSLFYTKRDLALRVGCLFVTAAAAGAFGGLLAFAIGFMDGVAGLGGWRWIFIIEGIPSAVVGVSLWWWLADEPATAYYLKPHEKRLAQARLDKQLGMTKSAFEFHWADVRRGLKDWKCWAFYFAQFGVDTCLYGYSTFLPTIIRAINPDASTAMVQVLTIPCYAVGAMAYLFAAFMSDRQQVRGPWAVAGGVVNVCGYGMLVSNGGPSVRYAGCFLVALGLYVTVGIPLAWLPVNNPRYGKRTTAVGLQLTIGNCAGILAAFIYPTADGPRFVTGHVTTMAMVAFANAIYAFMTIHFRERNKRRSSGKEDYKVEGMSEDEINELGDRSPRFVFTT